MKEERKRMRERRLSRPSKTPEGREDRLLESRVKREINLNINVNGMKMK